MHFSFAKRVFISDKKTRQLFAVYAKKGLSTMEMEELRQCFQLNAPYLIPLINHINEKSGVQHCPKKRWTKFIESISSSSAVCALIPISAMEIIEALCQKDITCDPEVILFMYD